MGLKRSNPGCFLLKPDLRGGRGVPLRPISTNPRIFTETGNPHERLGSLLNRVGVPPNIGFEQKHPGFDRFRSIPVDPEISIKKYLKLAENGRSTFLQFLEER